MTAGESDSTVEPDLIRRLLEEVVGHTVEELFPTEAADTIRGISENIGDTVAPPAPFSEPLRQSDHAATSGRWSPSTDPGGPGPTARRRLPLTSPPGTG